jgi:hypothetical protein
MCGLGVHSPITFGAHPNLNSKAAASVLPDAEALAELLIRLSLACDNKPYKGWDRINIG